MLNQSVIVYFLFAVTKRDILLSENNQCKIGHEFKTNIFLIREFIFFLFKTFF